MGEKYVEDGGPRDRYKFYHSNGTISYSRYTSPAMAVFDNSNTEFDDFKDDLVLGAPEEEVKTSLTNLSQNELPS